jgi:hypothetical protein
MRFHSVLLVVTLLLAVFVTVGAAQVVLPSGTIVALSGDGIGGVCYAEGVRDNSGRFIGYRIFHRDANGTVAIVASDPSPVGYLPYGSTTAGALTNRTAAEKPQFACTGISVFFRVYFPTGGYRLFQRDYGDTGEPAFLADFSNPQIVVSRGDRVLVVDNNTTLGNVVYQYHPNMTEVNELGLFNQFASYCATNQDLYGLVSIGNFTQANTLTGDISPLSSAKAVMPTFYPTRNQTTLACSNFGAAHIFRTIKDSLTVRDLVSGVATDYPLPGMLYGAAMADDGTVFVAVNYDGGMKVFSLSLSAGAMSQVDLGTARLSDNIYLAVSGGTLYVASY